MMDFHYPMRPAPADQLTWEVMNDPTAWYWQPKYNGWHVLALPDGRLFTRHGQDISAWHGVQPILRALQTSVPVVGELLNGRDHNSIQALRRFGAGTLMIFDLVIPGTFAERSAACAVLATQPGVVEVGETHPPCTSWDEIRSRLASEKRKGYEGIVLKHRDGLYELGRERSVTSRRQMKLKD